MTDWVVFFTGVFLTATPLAVVLLMPSTDKFTVGIGMVLLALVSALICMVMSVHEKSE